MELPLLHTSQFKLKSPKMPNFLELKAENLEMWRSQLEHQLESAIGFWHT